MTEGEMDTLLRVRGQRNDVVHGRRDTVDQADVQQAVALLARIIVYASERRLDSNRIDSLGELPDASAP